MEKEMQQKMIMYQLLERHLASLRQQAALLELLHYKRAEEAGSAGNEEATS